MPFYFEISCVLIGALLIVGVVLALKGSETAQTFLWMWAVALMACTPFISKGSPFFIRQLPAVGIVIVIVMICFLFYWETNNDDASQRETRRLLGEMNARIDAERKFLAGRLHDDVNHKLLEAKMYLRKLRPLIEKMDDSEASRSAQMIVMNVQDLVYDTYVECREIIKNTRVEIIESIGLIAALNDMISQYKAVLQQPRLIFDHNLTTTTTPTGETAVMVYRFIQESMLNVVKHAKATNARIRFYYRPKSTDYVVEIKDDGIGFNPSRKVSGIGMIDMRERARTLGGELQITAAPGQGCRIRLKFRFNEEFSKETIFDDSIQ